MNIRIKYDKYVGVNIKVIRINYNVLNVKLVISEFQFIVLFCNGVKDVNFGLF